MANAQKGEVLLKVGEEELTLLFSIDALCQLEEKAGRPFSAVLAEMSDAETRTVRTTRLLLWAGLREKHPEKTLLQAGNLIVPAGGMNVLLVPLFRAIELAFPTEGDSEDPPDQPSQ